MLTPAKSKLGRVYGYRPPSADHHLLKVIQPIRLDVTGPLPDAVDWTFLMRPVRDQGQEGSCFAHAAAALKEFNSALWGGGTVALGGYLSVAYLSWRTRLAIGTFPQDSGASIADVMAVLQAWGVCPETWLPYNQDPSEAGNAGCDVGAKPYRTGTPCTVPLTEEAFKQVLAAKKTIAIGFQVFESFEDTGPDGIVRPVQPGESSLGGHAVLVVGYDAKGFKVRNSWGSAWGDGGYCYWAPDYLSNCFEAMTTA